MKQTTNYGFNKPELQDSPPDITVLNPNFDKIDGQLKSLTDKDTELNTAINQVKTDYLPKTGGNVTQGLTVKNKTVAVSVNGSVADANGNITIDVGGDVQSVNGVQPDSNGNVVLDLGGDVQSVDGVEPDAKGNVALNASTRDEILEATKRVTDVEPDASVAVLENLQTSVARMESNLDAKIDKSNAYIVETWRSGNNWYRKYSDGWIEQGGYIEQTKINSFSLNTAFTSTQYTVAVSIANATWNNDLYVMGRTTTTVEVKEGNANYPSINTTFPFFWYACGY